MFFKRQKIEGIFDVAMQEVAPGEIGLSDGRRPSFKHAIVRPAVRRRRGGRGLGLENPKGFIEGARGHCERASCRLGEERIRLTRVLELRAVDVAKSRPVAGAAAGRPMG